MTAPSFVQYSYAATGKTLTLPAASTPGNLLIIAAKGNNPISEPAGWTNLNLPFNTYTGWSYPLLCYKISTGETSATITNFGDVVDSAGIIEYQISNPFLFGSFTVNPELSPPGYTTGPSTPYTTGPQVVLGFSFCSGPQGSDNAGVGSPATLRNPIGGAHAGSEIYMTDWLIDATSAGTVSWNYTYTDLGNAVSFGLVFAAGADVVCNPRIIDNFNRVVSITSEFESYDRSFYGPIWAADNSIPAAGGGGTTTFDDFNRTTTSPSIGTSSSGFTYTGGGPTGSSSVNVDGSKLVASIAQNDGFYRDATGAGPWADSGGWIMTAICTCAVVPSVTAERMSFQFITLPNYDVLEVDVSSDSSSGVVSLGAGSAPKFDYTSGQSFYVKWERRPSGVNRVKVWDTNLSEPGSWLIEDSADATTITGFELDLENFFTTATTDLYIDNIDFETGTSGSSSIYSVDGQEAYLDIDLVGDPGNNHQETLTVPFELWMLGNTDYSVRFKVSTIPNGSGSDHYTEFYFKIAGPTTDIVVALKISSSGTYGSLNIGPTSVTKTDWIANEWYTLEIQRYDIESRIRVWADSESRPSTAQAVHSADFSWSLGSDAVFTVDLIWSNITTSSDGRYKFYVDDIIAGCVESAPITPPTATFGTYTRDRALLSIRASFTDDSLYNHSFVMGTGDKSVTYYSEVRDDDVTSPTRIASIGDRVFKYETDQISSQDAADKAALKVFLDHCLVSEDIDLEAICNPAFEGNDVIAVQELTFSELNKKFRIRAFTIPLSSSRQVFKLSRVIAL